MSYNKKRLRSKTKSGHVFVQTLFESGCCLQVLHNKNLLSIITKFIDNPKDANTLMSLTPRLYFEFYPIFFSQFVSLRSYKCIFPDIGILIETVIYNNWETNIFNEEALWKATVQLHALSCEAIPLNYMNFLERLVGLCYHYQPTGKSTFLVQLSTKKVPDAKHILVMQVIYLLQCHRVQSAFQLLESVCIDSRTFMLDISLSQWMREHRLWAFIYYKTPRRTHLFLTENYGAYDFMCVVFQNSFVEIFQTSSWRFVNDMLLYVTSLFREKAPLMEPLVSLKLR